jgi:hypothetical protein
VNDNRDSVTGFPVHLPAYFYVNETWFEFFRLLPGFAVVDVHDLRLDDGRQVTIQVPDCHSFLHVTAFRFYAS